jgi:superfamily II DNA or RNA helicase
MFLRVGNAWTEVSDASPKEEAFVRDFLSVRTKGRHGKLTFTSLLRSGKFPAGLSRRIVARARENGFEVQVVKRTTEVEMLGGHSHGSWAAFPHQIQAVEEIRAHRRGIIQHSTGCLSGDTQIEVNRNGFSFKLPLRDLVKRLRGQRIGRGGGPHWNLGVPTTVRYRDSDGCIRLGKLRDAYASGRKTTFLLQTAIGKSIRATADHRFLTPGGWKPLSLLRADDEVLVALGAPTQTKKQRKRHYDIVGRLYRHPYAGRRNTARGDLASVPKHRLVVEAALNKVSYDDYVRDLRGGGSVAGYTFLDPKIWAVHHEDGNPRNNHLENLQVLSHKEHASQHGKEGGWRRVTEKTGPTKITHITEFGEEETYDIEMECEPHNFMANGFVVHNSGKGDLIAFLCTRFPKARVLVVVTSKELLRDMYRRLREKMKLRSVGRYGDGHREDGRVIVAIDDSLRRMPMELLRRFEVILGDEVHGAAAASYLEPLLQCVNAPYRVGFSGTPLDRADRRTVYILGAFGEVIHRYMPREAAEDGVISKARIVMVPFQHEVHSTRGGYSEWELRAYARNRVRNLLALRLLSQDSKRSMGFLRTIKHQEELARLVGTSALTVNHEDSAEAMDQALQRFRAGGKILLSTPILRQGTDIAEVERVVNLAGGKAIVDVIQKVGRGSRIRQPDGTLKESFEVYDIDDRGCGCGVRGEPTSYLHKSCEWLERHSDERRAAYWKYGYTVHDP